MCIFIFVLSFFCIYKYNEYIGNHGNRNNFSNILPLNSHYFSHIKIESLFTINWYYNSHNMKWMDILLCFISIGFQLVLLNTIKLLTEINKLKQKQLAAEPISKQSSNVDFIDNEPLKGYKLYKTIFKFFINLLIYIVGCIYICNYFIILSLPTNNILNINANMSSFMAYSMVLYLMLFNKYSIRNLIDSFLTLINWKQYYQFYQSSMIILHYINCVIIPFIACIILLQDCGRNWIKFWNICTNNCLKHEMFDVSIETDYSTSYTSFSNPHFPVLTPNEFNSQNINKCNHIKNIERQKYCLSVIYLDMTIGEIINKLKDKNMITR